MFGVGMLGSEQSSLPAPRIFTVLAATTEELPSASRSPDVSTSWPAARLSTFVGVPFESRTHHVLERHDTKAGGSSG
jgi:hypothetical protein